MSRAASLIPIYVTAITLMGTLAGLVYNGLHDLTREPCTMARDWLVAASPNPALTPAQRDQVSAAMVGKALECVK